MPEKFEFLFICYKDLLILIKDANALCLCWKKSTDFISEYNERKYNIMQIQAEKNTMQQHSKRKTKNTLSTSGIGNLKEMWESMRKS